MIHLLSSRIADFFVARNVAEDEEKEVCVYGLELIISGIISVGTVLIIGALINNMWYALLYNIIMVVIRMYTGGYHADTHIGCNLCYSFTVLISIGNLRLLIYYNVCECSLMMAQAGFIEIVNYAPLEHHNKTLSKTQKTSYQNISLGMYTISVFISSFLLIISLSLSSEKSMLLRSTGSYINITLFLIAFLFRLLLDQMFQLELMRELHM